MIKLDAVVCQPPSDRRIRSRVGRAFTAILDGEIKTERPAANVKVAALDAIVPVESATLEDSDKNSAKEKKGKQFSLIKGLKK